ncbi:hypothetical protein FNV43_RR17584 [Rhamnella rubrinervis]|uniref:RRM domain-containing protein n=1 Tax=Rhamnella rubrinervis TaxID=2594499 RepID=A0A8K0E3F6_9ROSA|nr:hypothetical protein FNV43_RR17584 [Rhamnella rubrinervis]
MDEETLTPKSQHPTSEKHHDDSNDDDDQPMPDLPHQNPSLPSSQSDTDSGSNGDDEAEDNLQLQNVEAELSTNPSNYDAHVQKIKLMRKMGEIEKLRQAREAMSELFPLTPTMWQEWASDESSINVGDEAFSSIEKLYERGVFDYLSASLWCDYLSFVKEHDPSVRECSPTGIAKARDLYERALTAAGLHIAEGNKIWEAYREFEQAILEAIHDTDIQAKEKQIQRIRSIFHRQLSVPLVNMRSTLLAYKGWEVEQGKALDTKSSDLDGVPSHVASAYHKALEMYNARIHLEEQISRQDISDSERLQQFMNYLKFEESSGDPARAQVLYERAITEFPISSDFWLGYTRYMDKTLKVGSVVSNVYSRAIKNCPWVGELWVRYLLSLERGHASEKEICSVFEKSLQCTFSTIDEYLDLFLTRIDGLRRRISFTSEKEDVLDYSLIRETFQHATDYLSPHLKNTDGLLRLHAYWARLELKLGKDLVAARGVWESLLKICGSMLEAWQGYIAMEIELGHINEARSIYRRCYSKRFPESGAEDICHSWLRFEREFGTLEDLDHSVQKVTPRLEELQLFRSRLKSKLIEERENSFKNAREKRKPVSDISDQQSPAKRQKDTSQNLKKVHEKDKGQVEDLIEQNKMDEITQVDKPDIKNDIQRKEAVPEKGKVFTDQCTAFISNLNLKVTSEDLLEFFSDVGGVVDIRILHDKFTGKSRVHIHCSKNKQTLRGKQLSIARSNPKHGKKEKSGQNVQKKQAGGSSSKESVEASKESRAPLSTARKSRVDNDQLKGKNTFAVPRNVRALGFMSNKPKTEEQDENPKSNDEFRKMFIKG